MKPTRSLRQAALVLTGIGVLITLPMTGLIIIGRTNDMGVLFAPSVLLMIGGLLLIGGLITLVIDAVVRLTGRRW